MKIRAISLHQPWATAVALGSKHIETRSWSTDYRGVLAIHAAKRRVISELDGYDSDYAWRAALGRGRRDSCPAPLSEALPFGAIVAVGRLVDCQPTDEITNHTLHRFHYPPGQEGSMLWRWTEWQMGNFALGRYGWQLADIVALPTPIPCVGRQSFFSWEVPVEVVAVHGVAALLPP